MRAPLPLVVSLVVGLPLVPAPSGAWQTLLPDTPDNGRPFAVAADAGNDVLVAGRVLAATGDDDGFLAKLGGSDGGVVWQQRFDGTALPGSGGEDVAAEVLRGLALAPGNDAVAVGLTVDTTSGADLLVTRRAALDGALVWQRAVDGGANLADDAQGVTLDPSGDVLVTGALTTAGATLAQPAVFKLASASGDEGWRVVLPGDGGTGRAIASDAGGDAFVAGDVGAGWFVTKRAGADGAQLWRSDLPGEPGNAVARALALRPGGASVVAGRLFTAATGQDFTVVALGADGGEQWRYTLDGTAVGAADLDEAFSVAVDANGDVVAAGVVSNAATDDDLVVVKLDGITKVEKWSRVIDGANSNDDDASAVAIDLAGNVVVVGSIRNAGSGRDLTVLLLDGVSGAERWRRVVDGATGQADVGFAVAVSGDGAVLAAGRTRNGPTADGLTVLKLASATGGDFPCGNGTLEGDEVCDDANLDLGDGCRPDCTAEVCGDAIRDPQETCDDGNTEDGDCCSALCATDSNGTACDDADACTSGDACVGGTCRGALTVCQASNDCHEAACAPETGLCGEVPRPDGRLCDDGDACTVVDECVAGECSPGAARICDDFEPCTADSCAPATGCVYDPYTDFDGVVCAFDPTRIATFCFAGLPRAIERRLERAEEKVQKAGESLPKIGRVARLLKSACKLAGQAQSRAAKQTARGDLSPACGAALADVLDDVCLRALALRDEIRSGQ